MLRSPFPHPENPDQTAAELDQQAPRQRRVALFPWLAGGAALALAALPVLPPAAANTAPAPEDLTKAFSAQWGRCFNADPTTAEAQDLYGPFVVEGTTVKIIPRRYNKQSGTWELHTQPVSMGPGGTITNGALVFYYDLANKQFHPDIPTSYLTGNAPCAVDTDSTIPQPTSSPTA